ncbi:MAG TPA: BamA/TamA family outer membrane protein [Thermoanaerobaculia bacterium]
MFERSERLGAAAIVAAVLAAASAAAQPATAQHEVIGEVRVHGNHTTPDGDVLALAGLMVGSPLTPDTLQAAETRLRVSNRFANVEVRKRFRSLTDASDVLVIILVDEVTGVSDTDLTPGPLKRLRGAGMWLPVLDYADGYGFTYGARVSFVDALGSRSRVSFPLTWGGERRAALDVDRSFDGGPFSRVEGTLALSRRENPHFHIAETRRAAGFRAERFLTSWLRTGAGASLNNVRFGSVDENHTTSGVDLIVDTRRDPVFPRNAIHTAVSWEHLNFARSPDANRRSTDLRGYVGLVGSSVLALRLTTSHASAPLPPYEEPLVGGTALLRGYRFGYRAGDNLAALSAELRVPVTSPLQLSRFGVKGFVDYGTVYAHGDALKDQRFDRGIGAGVFLTATVIRMGLDVAWPRSGKARAHFALGVTF